MPVQEFLPLSYFIWFKSSPARIKDFEAFQSLIKIKSTNFQLYQCLPKHSPWLFCPPSLWPVLQRPASFRLLTQRLVAPTKTWEEETVLFWSSSVTTISSRLIRRSSNEEPTISRMLKMPWPKSTRRLMRKELKVSQTQTLQRSTGLLTLTKENTRVFSVLLLSQVRSKGLL